MLDWFHSYLINRTQIVKVKGYSSTPIKVHLGVPQGSHFGPILFNIFINDIKGVLLYSHILLYADDIKIYRVISSVFDVHLLQEDLSKIVEWSLRNELSINVAKSKVVSFHKKHVSSINGIYSVNTLNLERLT